MHQRLLVTFISLLILSNLLNICWKFSIFHIEQASLLQLQEWVQLNQDILQVWIPVHPFFLDLLPLLLVVMKFIKHIFLNIFYASFQFASSLDL